MSDSRRIVVALFIALSAGALAPRASGADVIFNQVDWLADGGGYTAFNSEWGFATVQWDASDLARFNYDGQKYSGFINLVTRLPGGEDNWAVHNMPVMFSNPAELTQRVGDGFDFNLGIARGSQAVAGLDYYLSVDPAPIQNAQPGLMTGAAVTKDERLIGGLIIPELGISGGSGQFEPPPAQNFNAFSSVASRGNGVPGFQCAKIKVPDSQVTPVDEPNNYCAPGGVTRGLRYLDTQSNAFSLSQTTPQLLQTLATKMETDSEGTYTRKVFQGKQAYCDMFNLPITNTEVVDVCLAFETIVNGGAVEINLQWGKKLTTNENMGGHTAFVAEICKNIDAGGTVLDYWVRLIDDPKQGDGLARNRSYWLNFNGSNSLLGWWPGARLYSFITETAPQVPGPAGVALFGVGVMGFGVRRARRA